MAQYYAPSGKSSSTSILYLVIVCLIVAPLLALLYSYAIWYIPFIYVNFLITAGFGLILGLSVRYLVIKLGKVRNAKVAIIFGIITAVLAWYFQWVVYVDLLMNTSDYIGTERIGISISSINMNETIAMASNPGFILEIMGTLFDYGSWGLFGISVSGIFLAVIWLIEFSIIVFLAAIMGVEVTKKPFCEITNKWFDEKIIGPFEYINEKQQLKEALESSSRSSFENLVTTENDQKNHSLFHLYTSGQGQSYLTVENKEAILSDGELEWSDEQFVETISISDELKRSLLSKVDNTEKNTLSV